ncbi:hypothetical protein [Streptomyces spongiicola]|uniref:hypothetical protein n=1 Tax=Streptomyces spongiicola TaxID=1690221 RepID=UPI0013A54B02|nr:hypothetical protein [Streptomyces spongiicola]
MTVMKVMKVMTAATAVTVMGTVMGMTAVMPPVAAGYLPHRGPRRGHRTDRMKG